MFAKSQVVRDTVIGDCKGYFSNNVKGKGVFGRVGLQTKRSYPHQGRDTDVVLCTENPKDLEKP